MLQRQSGSFDGVFIAEETELWNEHTVAILAHSNILYYQPPSPTRWRGYTKKGKVWCQTVYFSVIWCAIVELGNTNQAKAILACANILCFHLPLL